MASTINSDNGVVSGTSGLKSTADTSGVLALQSNGSTALSISTGLITTLTNPLPVGSGGTGIATTPTAGAVPYGNGTTLAYTAAGTSGQVLTSAGGSAPTWSTISAGNFGTDITYTDYSLTTSTALNSAAGEIWMQAVSLDGTSELMILGGNSSAHAVVWNSSTNTFGTPVLVRTASLASCNNIALAKVSSTSVLMCSLPTGDTALETVVLTVSGSTITVNTAVATTLAATSTLITANTRLVTVGSSYVLNYYDYTTLAPTFIAITVSGTTPTIGAELTGTGLTGQQSAYAYSSTILLQFSSTTTAISAAPISVSGTTLTNGTRAVLVTGGTGAQYYCAGLLSTGRYALAYKTNGVASVTAGLVSVAGTTASFTAAATKLTSTASLQPSMQIFSNQAFICTGYIAGESIGVLTDTAGSATVGTGVTVPIAGAIVGYLSTGKILFSSFTAGNSAYYQYGISSGAAVLEKTFQNVTSTTAVTAQTAKVAFYSTPLSGPPQSGGNQVPMLRTSAGKIAAGFSSTQPFTTSIDGTNPAKLQQSANPYVAYNDAISDAVNWGVPALTSGTATTVTMRKVTLT
jgi:hypothetical protein